MEKKYSNDEIEVLWKQDLCIHSANCFRNLPQVFRPSVKPWIDVSKASTEKIIETVNKCPSGALTYKFKNIVENVTNSPQALKCDVMGNGPILIPGPLTLVINGVEQVIDKPRIAICRCGHSKNKPFCDGDHKSNGFVG